MQQKHKILIADDNEVIRESISEILTEAGYHATAVEDGEKAVIAILEGDFDLIILDYRMPHKNGFEVVSEVRKHPAFTDVPIIILTSDMEKATKLEGLALDIDEFLTKPADKDEILARVKLLIKRSGQRVDINPLTKLPGNPSIQARAERALARGDKFAMIYVDLNNFKAYNDTYSYVAGDKVILETAHILREVVLGQDPDGFVGHIGGDDFVAICTYPAAELIAKKLAMTFKQALKRFYKEEDLKRGHIKAKNRRGEEEEYPLLSLAIGVAHNNLKPLGSYARAVGILNELKHYSKAMGDCYIAIDRRTD